MSLETQTVVSSERQCRLTLVRRDAARGGHAASVRAAASRERRPSTIRLNDATPPVDIPPGHIGPVVLPGTGRLVYWTGRVAIGLRHQPSPRCEPVPQSALWVQDLMLGPGQAAA